MPLIAAGQVTDPSVSVPIAKRTMPAATAAPLPLDDPHGLRSSAHGLCVWPPTALQPEIEWFERMFAHSLRLVLPTMTAPAARSRATSGASRLVTLFASARLPAVVGSGPGAFDIVLDQHRLAGERAAQIAGIDPPRLVDRGRDRPRSPNGAADRSARSARARPGHSLRPGQRLRGSGRCRRERPATS